MGNAAPQVKTVGGGAPAQRDPSAFLQLDLPRLIKKHELGGKFMKSFLCRVEDGVPVVVKVYVRHDGEQIGDLARARDGIEEVQTKLNALAHPNLLPYQRTIIGQQLRGRLTSAGYLIRQHFYNSLNDRLSTRPFLSIVEKKWIVYQLFQAVSQCHSVGICHGDIKTENIMVTSWTWITLTDFASFKPTYLPEDDPTDFNHFFASASSTGQHRCYLAPERFYSSSADAETEATLKGLDPRVASGDPGKAVDPAGRRVGNLHPSMDVFSLGCVIAEVFLGTPVLDLPMLLQYRSAPTQDQDAVLAKLDKIDAIAVGPEVKNLVKNMLQRDPSQRKDASEYLRRCETVVGASGGPLFPTSFGGLLYPLMVVLQREVHTPDERIMFVARHYGRIMAQCVGIPDHEGASFFAHFAPADVTIPGGELGLADGGDGVVGDNLGRVTSAAAASLPAVLAAPTGAPIALAALAPLEDDDLEALAEETRRLIAELDASAPAGEAGKSAPSAPAPPHLVPGAGAPDADRGAPPPENALIVVVQLVCSCVRHVREPQSKLIALQLLARFSRHLDDEARLQRLVPYVIALLEGPDQNAAVRASAVRVVNDILGMVEKFQASDAEIFPKYVFPTLQKLPTDPEELVRVAFAESIAGLAETSRRFLEINQGFLVSGTGEAAAGAAGAAAVGSAEAASSGQASGESAAFEEKLEALHTTVSKWIHDLVGDNETAGVGAGGARGSAGRSNLVKRALLRDITRICVFFGASGTEQKMLPLLITMINDRDWELRYALCAHIPALGAFLGPVVTENFIMPLSHPLIVDVEELVVSRALRCLATLTELGLLVRETMLERAGYAAPLLLHPSGWVRHSTAALVASIARRLGPADSHASLYPKLADFVSVDLAQCAPAARGVISKEAVAAASATPVSRLALKVELMRLAATLRPSAAPQPQGAPVAPEPDAAEQQKLAAMGTYLDAAAKNLMQKMQTGGDSTAPGGATVTSRRTLTTTSGGELSRLQLHSERLNSTPSSSLFLPKTAAAVHVSGGAGRAVMDPQERDGLLALRRAFLDDFLARHGQRPLAVWALPRELRELDRMQKLFGVATNSRDAVRFANRSFQTEGDDYDAAERRRAGPDGASGGSSTGGGPEGAQALTAKLGASESFTISATVAAAGAVAGGNGAAAAVRHLELCSGLEAMGGEAASEGVEAATLQRRILGLGIPPLPPDFGAPRRFVAPESQGGGSAATGATATVAAAASAAAHPAAAGPAGISPAATAAAASASVAPPGAAGASTAAVAKSKEWRPKVGGVVVQTLTEHMPRDEHGGFRGTSSAHEHTGAVNRLAVSPDHSFFVSASSDGTSRVWATSQLETNVAPRAAAVYAQQSGRILDACSVESSRSVCTGSDSGDVHVWRVDLLSGGGQGGGPGNGAGDSSAGASVGRPPTAGATGSRESMRESMGTVEVRRVPLPSEGPVLAVAHFNTDSSSMLLYGTQRGYIHCWDLRAEVEPWCLRVSPELGFLTTLAVGSGSDKSWLCAGTSRGYVCIWDLRFQLLVRLWRHSSHGPIHRLATCARLPEDPEGAPPQPLAFVAAGSSELAVWNLATGGPCRRCFRSLQPQDGQAQAVPLPTLESIPVPQHPAVPVFGESGGPLGVTAASLTEVHSVRAIMGRISTNGNSYVITGSTDKHIRFWDMSTPAKCFTVSGLDPGQPRPAYESVTVPSNPDTSLVVCYDAEVPSRENVVPSHLPIREQRGLVAPAPGHNDAILDLKGIDLPSKMMLSSSRDGVVKCWK